MTEISDVGQFSYQLRTLPEAIYGGDIGGNITTITTTQPQGLIGEIYENVSLKNKNKTTQKNQKTNNNKCLIV